MWGIFGINEDFPVPLFDVHVKSQKVKQKASVAIFLKETSDQKIEENGKYSKEL